MNVSRYRSVRNTLFVAMAFGVAACSSMTSNVDTVTLTGANEVPAVATAATATSTIAIAADGLVTGSIVVSGMTPTMAHIHQAAPGMNGPVIVPFTQNGNTFSPPPFTKLTDSQMSAYRAGNLYVNVHSAAHPGGEIRVQLKTG